MAQLKPVPLASRELRLRLTPPPTPSNNAGAVRSRAVAPVKIALIELGRASAQVLQHQLDHEGLTLG